MCDIRSAPLKNAEKTHTLVCKALLDFYFCVTMMYIRQGTKNEVLYAAKI